MSQDLIFWICDGAVALAAIALTIHSSKNWRGAGVFLCDDCRFNQPDLCHKSDRTTAVICTAYRPLSVDRKDAQKAAVSEDSKPKLSD